LRRLFGMKRRGVRAGVLRSAPAAATAIAPGAIS